MHVYRKKDGWIDGMMSKQTDRQTFFQPRTKKAYDQSIKIAMDSAAAAAAAAG